MVHVWHPSICNPLVPYTQSDPQFADVDRLVEYAPSGANVPAAQSVHDVDESLSASDVPAAHTVQSTAPFVAATYVQSLPDPLRPVWSFVHRDPPWVSVAGDVFDRYGVVSSASDKLHVVPAADAADASHRSRLGAW